jgi:predicted permease
MAARPAFALVAIVSLALGIGANTAIFSVWHGLIRAPLPGVERPGELVMLTPPGASGMWRGGWNGRTDGPRAWVTYAEFEQLRDRVPAFSGLMASQSSLVPWVARISNGAPEETRGRLVSGGFFQLLGVRPAIGRLFSPADDRGQPAIAVISHPYWRRRFEGRPDVLGRTLTIRDATVTIVGVTPPGFVGETSDQRPDLWLPLRLQPLVMPGGDWLREQPPDKVMWLRAFGRLKPGATLAQAETQANAVLQANLESFHGPARTARDGSFRDERLALLPGARGASITRGEFASSLTMLLVSVGVLLLIACANLANLLLARGAARRAEIAIRLSLGASRARLVRQLVTESLALAAVGGVAALGVAWLLHEALVRMLQEAEPRFALGFTFDVRIVAFTAGATIAAALAFGALPAWHMTGDAGGHLEAGSRRTIGSARELRAGRWLVGAQLALSLPLLVGAGLLVRTADNLQRQDLGFDPRRLLLARVDLGPLALDPARSDPVLRRMLEDVQRIPGVQAATFSQNGLFTGGYSTATIEVDAEAASAGREAPLDRVGAGYFTVLGVPILQGRDILAADGRETHRVCLVNEAFVRRFFDGRNPLGRRVSTVDEGERSSFEVVGVVKDARTRSVRAEVEAQFYVPAEQRPSLGTNRWLLIRAAAATTALAPLVRQAVNGPGGGLSLTSLRSFDEQLAPFTAEDRTNAALATVFGAVALALSAIGLYGVLAFAITRRASEIAIRIALGAQSRQVMAMILRETLVLVVAGLAAGGALAYAGSRMIAGRLYDVDPRDPLTFVLATAVLLAVALVAAFVPARRASRLDPIAALHQGS